MDTRSPLVEVFAASLEDMGRYAADGHLYAVIDACDVPAVPAKYLELGEERVRSLYRGTAQEQHWTIAPYLFRVDDQILNWIAQTLWAEPRGMADPWGIFVISSADLQTLWSHFRKFLVVQSPEEEEEEEWYFRFYDPRIFRKFYAKCFPDELRRLFGPVYGYGLTEPAIVTLLWMQQAEPDSALQQPLPAGEAPPFETSPGTTRRFSTRGGSCL